MSTRNIGIVMDQTTDFSLVIGINGVDGPIDITDYEFKSQMRKDTNPSSPVVAEFQFTILDQTTNKGQVQWFLPATDNSEEDITTAIATPLTALRQTTQFVFDVKMKDSIGNISRIIQGIIYLSPEATQETFP